MRSISIVIGRVITLVAAMAEREKHRSGVSLSVCLFVFQQQQRESSGDASIDLEPAASVRFGRTVRGPIHVRDVEHCLRLRDEALRNRIKCVRARQIGLD